MSLGGSDKTVEARLRDLLKSPANTRCFNCSSMGANYVVPQHGVFVCTDCSGKHMHAGHRVKSVSMGKFSEAECKNLEEEGGNAKAALRYLAAWSNDRLPRPTDRDPKKVEVWIREVLDCKKFCAKEGERSMVGGATQDHDSIKSIPVKNVSELLGPSSPVRLLVSTTKPGKAESMDNPFAAPTDNLRPVVGTQLPSGITSKINGTGTGYAPPPSYQVPTDPFNPFGEARVASPMMEKQLKVVPEPVGVQPGPYLSSGVAPTHSALSQMSSQWSSFGEGTTSSKGPPPPTYHGHSSAEQKLAVLPNGVVLPSGQNPIKPSNQGNFTAAAYLAPPQQAGPAQGAGAWSSFEASFHPSPAATIRATVMAPSPAEVARYTEQTRATQVATFKAPGAAEVISSGTKTTVNTIFQQQTNKAAPVSAPGWGAGSQQMTWDEFCGAATMTQQVPSSGSAFPPQRKELPSDLFSEPSSLGGASFKNTPEARPNPYSNAQGMGLPVGVAPPQQQSFVVQNQWTTPAWGGTVSTANGGGASLSNLASDMRQALPSATASYAAPPPPSAKSNNPFA